MPTSFRHSLRRGCTFSASSAKKAPQQRKETFSHTGRLASARYSATSLLGEKPRNFLHSKPQSSKPSVLGGGN